MNGFLSGFFGPENEFENAVCITKSNPSIEYATEQMVRHNDAAQIEFKKTLEEMQRRHSETHKAMWALIKQALREQGLFPKNYNEKTDTFRYEAGVIFHSRRKVDESCGD